jgi:acetolactate synthase I/II/III large subunit
MNPGGHIIVKALHKLGARRVFCVAGESYLPVLDGFLDYPEIEVITCRQESGVTFMAEAHGQMTGTPGIALVTRGPGACNASIGVHTAMQSSTPMILLVGLIASQDRDKEAFQEFDLKQMYGSLSKWQAVIDSADRIGEYISRAWHIAMSGRPGPVVLGLPEDVLFPLTGDQEIHIIPQCEIAPKSTDIAAIKDKLSNAKRPLIVAGGSGWSDEAINDLAGFSSTNHIPVTTTFRCQDVFDHAHGNYIGELGTSSNPELIERVKQADVILALNSRLDEMTTQSYTLFSRDQTIIQTFPAAEEFGKSLMPAIAVQSHIAPLVSALAGSVRLDGRNWAQWRDEGRKAYQAWTTIAEGQGKSWKGADLTQIYRYLQQALPRDANITTDAGNFSGWAQRYLRYGRPGRLLAPVSGAMGYAVPSAVAASLEYPDRLALGICGDGGFMMSAQELATARHYGAKPVILVCNNGVYGTIRMHQQREYPGRASATGLTNPDFVKMGESYSMFSARITHAHDFPDIWEKALVSDTGVLIEVVMDPAQVSTRS